VGIASTDYAVQAEEKLREQVVAALGSDDGLELRAVRGSAVSALLAASADAELLVVGEVRAGRAGSVKTGLVAPQVVLRAPCPVVVMPRH
jgi:nucleotide-binding universal stress UspA family protein